MNNQENEIIYEYAVPATDPQKVQFDNEKREMRRTCNTVGLMMILATIIFSTFSMFVAISYGLFEGVGALPSFIDSVPDNIISGLANVAAIGVCGIAFIKLGKNKFSDVLVFDKLSSKKLFAVVAIGFTVCMISNLLTNFYLTATESLGLNLNFDIETPVSNSFLEILVYFLSTAIVPAFSEEILFRGAVLGTLRKYGDAFAIFVSSFLFGLFHGNFVQFPFAFIVGLVLSWAVVYTNSMLPAIIIHAANNGFSVLCDVLYTNAGSLGINESLVDALTFIVVAVVAILAIFAVAKLSKRDNSFMKLAGYNGALDRKTRTKMLVTSPTIIISVVFLLVESVSTHVTLSLM